MKNNHEFYMQIALELAKKGLGHTMPNPLVGCVIVKNGKIISTGWHKKAGMPHAEADALNKIKYRAKGSTLYVNLEPCSHSNKRTPPCTDAIIKYGVKMVVAAMTDPNPFVNTCGFHTLEKAGIKVINGIMKKEAQYLNRFFIKNIDEKAPYIIMKSGVSLDGKIALANGASQWITGPQSRSHSQVLRKSCDAIAAGIGTILKDDPFLDCRIDKTKQIKKVVFDSKGRMPLNANIFKNSKPTDVFIFTKNMAAQKRKILSKRGVNVIIQKGKGAIGLNAAVKELFLRGVMSLLVEGGGALHASFLEARLYDEAWVYVAPKIIGADGIDLAGPMGLKGLAKAPAISNPEFIRLGSDILIKGEIKYV